MASVGRGGRRGKTSGRGTKGQKARAGRKLRPELRDIIKKLPKLRGRGKNSFKVFRKKPVTINLNLLNSVFKDKEIVSPKTLIEKKIIKKTGSITPKVKVLSVGEIKKPLSIEGLEVSLPAKIKIEKVGGSIK